MTNSCDTVQNLFQGDGVTTVFSFTFEYDENKPEEVNVSLFDTTTKYYVPLDRSLWSFDGPTVVRLDTAPSAVTDDDGDAIANVKIWRRTNIESLVASFYPGSAIRAQDLNANFEQLRQAILEGRCIVPTPIYEYIQDNFWNKYGETIDSTETWISDDKHVATTGAINTIITGIDNEINDIEINIDQIESDINDINGNINDINGEINEIIDDIQEIIVTDLPSKWTKITETINTGETWVSNDNNVATTGAIQKQILSILDDPDVPTNGYWNKDGDTIDSTDGWSVSDNTIATTKAIDNQLIPIKSDVTTNTNNIATNALNIQANAVDIANRWDKSGDTLRSGWLSSDSLIATTKAITDTFPIVTTSTTPPDNPQDGDLWLNSNTGCLYFYYQDVNSSQWISVSTGPEGPVGPIGPEGNSATVDVGRTYTGPAGSSATVSNVGSIQNAVFEFVIPQGSDGKDGTDGTDGTNGKDGLAATIYVGNTTTTAPGSNAQVANVGTPNYAVFDFDIPRGATGATGAPGTPGDPGLSFTGPVPPSNPIEGQQWYNTNTGVNYIYYTDSDSSQWVSVSSGPEGPQGPQGPQGQEGTDGNDGIDGKNATISVGTTTTLYPGSNAYVHNSGSDTEAIFYFGIPQGYPGADGVNPTVSVGTTTTLAPGSKATVINTGTNTNAQFSFGIPKGEDGRPANAQPGALPPNSPYIGDLWFNSETGVTYVWYNDGDSSQWVSTSNSYSPAVAGYGTSFPNSPAIGQLFYSTTDSKLKLWNGSSWINI